MRDLNIRKPKGKRKVFGKSFKKEEKQDMKIESILNAQEITELAKERFKEERATDHLEGWFLAKEIMRECDEKFKEDVDSIRISKTLVEIAKRIPLWLSDYHIFA